MAVSIELLGLAAWAMETFPGWEVKTYPGDGGLTLMTDFMRGPIHLFLWVKEGVTTVELWAFGDGDVAVPCETYALNADDLQKGVERYCVTKIVPDFGEEVRDLVAKFRELVLDEGLDVSLELTTKLRELITELEQESVSAIVDAIPDVSLPEREERRLLRDLVLSSTRLRGEGKFAEAVALVESQIGRVQQAPAEERVLVYLEAFYAAREVGDGAKAKHFAERVAAIDPDVPTVKEFMGGN